MKKLSGFTLVELLVVITIIAILSVVGITVFTGVQKKAQDAKLKGDVAAFATAYELKYNQATGRYPSSLDTSSFVGGIPLQPDGSEYEGCSAGSGSCDLLGGDTDKPFRICAKLTTGEEDCKDSVWISDRGGTVTRTNVLIADLSTPTPTSSPSPSPTASTAPTASPSPSTSPSPSPSPSPALTATYIQTNVGCSTPSGLTPDQICQREVSSSSTSRAIPGSSTIMAKGYWWKQCGGASISNCNGLDCTINNLDCTNTPGSWGSQQPYPSQYLKSGNNTTVYNPTDPGWSCGGFSPGWTMRVYCSQ